MHNLQEQGRTCYKRGDYKEAIERFDRAIGRSPSVQLLDNRAACYEKLNDYSTALQDAKRAIQLHREDAVGYLRAGRLLVKMKKPSVALEIYTHGLKCIKHVGKGYELLHRVHKELMDELCPPTSVDPLTVLPRELAETILEYLSFRQRMNACLVSKQWTHFIRSIPSLWQHLDLSGARRKVRTAFISRAINIARARLKAVTLSNLYDFDKTLNALLKHCQLDDLTLLDCGAQSQSLVHILSSAKTLRSLKIAQGSVLSSHELHPLFEALSASLESFECRVVGRIKPVRYHVRCDKLKSLSLTFDDPCEHTVFFQELASHFPALEKLVLRQENGHIFADAPLFLRDCRRLQHLDFHMRAQSFVHVWLPPTLTVLKLDGRYSQTLPRCRLPSLEEFSIKGGKHSNNVQRLLDELRLDAQSELPESSAEPSEPSHLRKLTIADNFFRSDVELQQLLSHPRLRRLEHLCLAGSRLINDVTVAEIVHTKLEQLRYLDLTSADLTGVGVKSLISSLKLDTIILNECRNVSPDAIEWARLQDVVVKYRLGNGSAGGRKVRY